MGDGTTPSSALTFAAAALIWASAASTSRRRRPVAGREEALQRGEVLDPRPRGVALGEPAGVAYVGEGVETDEPGRGELESTDLDPRRVPPPEGLRHGADADRLGDRLGQEHGPIVARRAA